MRISLLAIVSLALTASCSALDLLEPRAAREVDSADVERFAQKQLSKLQAIDTLVHVPSQDVLVFRATFGDPIPNTMPCGGECPPGYPLAFGLKNGRKIGWLFGLFDSPGRYRFFEIGAEDHYLFTADFIRRLGAADPLLLEQEFKPLLVRSPATPEATLRLLTEGLYTWINPPLAELLLENPKVRTSTEMLALIADLPVFQGDAYRGVRVKARELLRQRRP